MPDPSGAERLLNYGCEISFKKDTLQYPVKIETPNDFKPGTKVPKLVSKPVWVVTITMPKKLMAEIQRGSIELENETLDTEDIETAYEQGMDDDVYKTPDEQQNVQQQAAPVPAPTI